MKRNNYNKKFRVIFCANQVSLAIAVALAQRDSDTVNTVIFYMPSRCDVLAFEKVKVRLIEYTKINFLLYIVGSIFARPDEVCVPHMKIGRMINAYGKYAYALSAIDDGLDTFREGPKNIAPSDFVFGSKYYTFNYDFKLASWLINFNVEKVCELNRLSISSRNVIDAKDFKQLIIESPGVDGSNFLNITNASSVLFVRHSNKNKNLNLHCHFSQLKGSDISIEKTLDSFVGEVLVGESMVLIYALHSGNKNLSIKIVIPEESYCNLKSIHPLISNSSNAILVNKRSVQ